MKVALTLGCSISLSSIAIACDTHHHHEGAHVHGIAHLNLVQDQPNILIADLKAPGATVYGFEHPAKSEKDQTTQQMALEKLKTQFPAGLGLPQEKQCELTDQSIQIEQGASGHSEVHASFQFTCKENLGGSSLQLDLAESFTALENLELKVLSEKQQYQKSLEHGHGNVNL